jgi:MSHA biogenesis protein MshI
MIEQILARAFGGRFQPGWLAVELDEKNVHVAHVLPDGRRPSVAFAETREWDPTEPKSLEKIAREFGARRFRCTTLLKPAEYQILLVEAPAVKRDELKPALRWRIKDMLDYHVDDATLDVLDVPLPGSAAQRTHYMYAVAARNETVRATIERFQSAGFPLAVIDIPETAQRNVAALYEKDERGVVALTFDAHGMLLTVNFAGELYLSRRLDISQEQLVAASGEEAVQLRDRVLVETQRSLDHCERTYNFFSLGRVVLEALPNDIGLREHLSSNLYLPVEPMDLDQVVDLPGGSAAAEAGSGGWLKLIGAGLRVEEKVF